MTPERRLLDWIERRRRCLFTWYRTTGRRAAQGAADGAMLGALVVGTVMVWRAGTSCPSGGWMASWWMAVAGGALLGLVAGITDETSR